MVQVTTTQSTFINDAKEKSGQYQNKKKSCSTHSVTKPQWQYFLICAQKCGKNFFSTHHNIIQLLTQYHSLASHSLSYQNEHLILSN